jgi:GTP cyclohydrolase II
MTGVGDHHLVRSREDVRLPTAFGIFRCRAYESPQGATHFLLTMGDIEQTKSPLVRIHSECLTGDVFGSLRCDCGAQLRQAMQAIAGSGRGILIYLRAHEGRGIGLGLKLRAYGLQDGGVDTIDANLSLGLPIDARDYGDAATILAELGIARIRLMTNNPGKLAAMRAAGIACRRVPLLTEPTDHNHRYLATKQHRLGHWLAHESPARSDPIDKIVVLPRADDAPSHEAT